MQKIVNIFQFVHAMPHELYFAILRHHRSHVTLKVFIVGQGTLDFAEGLPRSLNLIELLEKRYLRRRLYVA